MKQAWNTTFVYQTILCTVFLTIIGKTHPMEISNSTNSSHTESSQHLTNFTYQSYHPSIPHSSNSLFQGTFPQNLTSSEIINEDSETEEEMEQSTTTIPNIPQMQNISSIKETPTFRPSTILSSIFQKTGLPVNFNKTLPSYLVVQALQQFNQNLKTTNNSQDSLVEKLICPPQVITTELQSTSSQTFECPICSQICTSSSGLTRHKKNHNTKKPHLNKPYLCRICGRTYLSKSGLSDHLRLHSGEKPYSCKFCSETFPTCHYRNSHQKTCTQEKKYFCSCGQGFTKKRALSSHKRACSRTQNTQPTSINCESNNNDKK